MAKINKKEKRFFGLNYFVLSFFSVLLVLVVPIGLYFFEWNNYVEEKYQTVIQIQQDVDNKISTIKSALNYTFFEENFQNHLNGTLNEGETVDNKIIYNRLTALGILGNTIQTTWYFPLINGELSNDKKVLSGDILIKFLPEVLNKINADYSSDVYVHGKYFFFTIDSAIDEINAKSLIIGHWVLSAANNNFMQPIGVCVSIINSNVLTSAFSMVEDEGVKIGLYTANGELIYGYSASHESELEQLNIVKMQVLSSYESFKCVLYFDSLKVFYDFLPYIVSIAGIMIFLTVVFIVYLRIDEKRKTQIYDSFISTFRRISEGNTSDRIEEYNVEELDLVSKQFNLMMDSLNLLNKALGEEERKAYFSEKEKDRYIIKYLSTQINKHFIFNTFGVIRSFVNLRKTDSAAECIDLLCNYLRFTFKGKDYVTVEDEVKALQYYLDIQLIRLPKITVSINILDDIKQEQIPQFILQPIVENAYKHAFNRNSGKVFVEGKLNEDMIEFIVTDNGVGIGESNLKELNETLKVGEESANESGIGLINVQRRLKILMGERSYIRVESKEGEGTTVIVACERNRRE